MIKIIKERPAIHRLRFDDAARNTKSRVLQSWSWNRLSEVVTCLNDQNTGIHWTPEKAIIDFAPLCGHDGRGNAMVAFVVLFAHGYSSSLGQPLKEFRMRKGDYYIPTGWGIRMTDQRLLGLTQVELRLSDGPHCELSLVGLTGREKERDLPLKMSPYIHT